jgi:phage terminase large subunit
LLTHLADGLDPEVEGETTLAPPWRDGWLLRDDGKAYKPHSGQHTFHGSSARFRVLFGGRGSGKTTAGVQEALNNRIRFGLSGAVINPDFENFKFSTWPELRRWMPWEQVIEKDRRRMESYGWEPRGNFIIHFLNGAVVYCKGLKDPEAARGPNINWLWYDEGGRDRTGHAWRIAIAGVRQGHNPSAWVTTTPKGTRHWTATTFIEHVIEPEVAELLEAVGADPDNLYSHHTASIDDNADNLDPAFYASMRTSYSGKFAQQELDGLVVDITEGLVYDNFSVGNISADADYNPNRGAVEIAYDDGFSSSPRVFLFLQVGDDGVVNVFDELYHHKHQPQTCIGEAKERLLAHLRKYTPEDSELQYGQTIGGVSKNGSNGTEPENFVLPAYFEIAVGDPSAAQLRDAFRLADITARIPKEKSVLEGIKLVYNLVANDEGIVRIRFHPRAVNAVREFGQDYRWPEGGGGEGVKPIKEDDHGPDALRSWAMLRMRRISMERQRQTEQQLSASNVQTIPDTL